MYSSLSYSLSCLHYLTIHYHHAAQCASRGESFPCPDNLGPYNNGISETLPDGKGFIITQWNGWNFGDPDHQNGRSMFAAVSDVFISGCYCVYNDANGKIAYCYPEQYDTSPSESATEAECATNWYNAPTTAPTAAPTTTAAPTATSGTTSTSSNGDLNAESSLGIILGAGLGFTLVSALVYYYLWGRHLYTNDKEAQINNDRGNRTTRLDRGDGVRVMNPMFGSSTDL
jgi:hypothetical protein